MTRCAAPRSSPSPRDPPAASPGADVEPQVAARRAGRELQARAVGDEGADRGLGPGLAGDRGGDELGRDPRRGRIARVGVQFGGDERVDITAQHHRIVTRDSCSCCRRRWRAAGYPFQPSLQRRTIASIVSPAPSPRPGPAGSSGRAGGNWAPSQASWRAPSMLRDRPAAQGSLEPHAVAAARPGGGQAWGSTVLALVEQDHSTRPPKARDHTVAGRPRRARRGAVEADARSRLGRRQRAAPHQRRIVILLRHLAGIVVVDFVIVPGKEPRTGGVRCLQVGVAVVLGIARAIVAERIAFATS